MARIPVSERKMPPSSYLQSVPAYAGQRELAWPVSDMVDDIIADARAAGFASPYFNVISGFRTYAQQERLFNQAVQKYGSVAEARKWVAPPGKSAHNTGYTIDFYLGGPTNSSAVAQIQRDPAFKYMRDVIAPKYGLSPYAREPWHWECDKSCRATYIMRKYGVDGELARQIVDEESIVPQGDMVAFLESRTEDGEGEGETQVTRDDGKTEVTRNTDSKVGKTLLALSLVGGTSFGIWLWLKQRNENN